MALQIIPCGTAQRVMTESITDADPPEHEDIRPGFIEIGDQHIYCCLHFPTRSALRSTSITLCPPLAYEYERGHRALRQLAAQLTHVGFCVARFDYSGTGDSTDSGAESPAAWVREAQAVAEFARSKAQTSQSLFLGLRFGAFIAQLAAQNQGQDHGLALWRPLSDGRRLIDEFERRQKELAAALGRPEMDYADSILGWRISEPLRDAIRAMRLRESNDGSALYIASRVELDLISAVGGEYLEDNSDAFWIQDDLNAFVPAEIIQNIVDKLSEMCG